jgi:hypothetical protein
LPLILIYPLLGIISFVKDLNVVLFPAPFTPNKAKHSPNSTQKDVFSTAKIYFLNGI